MQRRKLLTAAAVTLGATLGLATPALAQLRIATVGPMTGGYAAFGQQMKEGAEQAVADLNKAGGVLGQQLQLEVGDDACDPKQAVSVANQMASKRVKLVAGHYCSGSSIPSATTSRLSVAPSATTAVASPDVSGLAPSLRNERSILRMSTGKRLK